MAFDDETVMKALKENDDQSCSETCVQLISTIYRSVKMYLKIKEHNKLNDSDPDSLDNDNDLDHIWSDFHKSISELIFYVTQFEPNITPQLINEYAQINKTISTILIQVFRSQEDFLSENNNSEDERVIREFYNGHYKS